MFVNIVRVRLLSKIEQPFTFPFISSKRRSGTEEQYEEKEKLLQDASDLAREFDHLPKAPLRQPRQAVRSPTGTNGTEAASARLSAAAGVRAAHAMRDAAASAAFENRCAAEANPQLDENGMS